MDTNAGILKKNLKGVPTYHFNNSNILIYNYDVLGMSINQIYYRS